MGEPVVSKFTMSCPSGVEEKVFHRLREKLPRDGTSRRDGEWYVWQRGSHSMRCREVKETASLEVEVTGPNDVASDALARQIRALIEGTFRSAR